MPKEIMPKFMPKEILLNLFLWKYILYFLFSTPNFTIFPRDLLFVKMEPKFFRTLAHCPRTVTSIS